MLLSFPHAPKSLQSTSLWMENYCSCKSLCFLWRDVCVATTRLWAVPLWCLADVACCSVLAWWSCLALPSTPFLSRKEEKQISFFWCIFLFIIKKEKGKNCSWKDCVFSQSVCSVTVMWCDWVVSLLSSTCAAGSLHFSLSLVSWWRGFDSCSGKR